MKDSSIAIAGLPDDFASQDDEGLVAFLNTLRLSVKATVGAEQQQGLSLAKIIVQVREIVRIAERDANQLKPFTSDALRTISKQAVAWCVEAYRPPVVTVGADLSPPSHAPDPLPPTPALVRNGHLRDRFPSLSPT
jgi:hypothetical protein